MVFNAVFRQYLSYITAAVHLSMLFQFFQPVLCTIFFPSHWLLPHLTNVETTDSSERGMNPVAMTIINPRKEYWPSQGSNQRPPVLNSQTLPTELWRSALNDASYRLSYGARHQTIIISLQVEIVINRNDKVNILFMKKFLFDMKGRKHCGENRELLITNIVSLLSHSDDLSSIKVNIHMGLFRKELNSRVFVYTISLCFICPAIRSLSYSSILNGTNFLYIEDKTSHLLNPYLLHLHII